jgi:hypothetical protein
MPNYGPAANPINRKRPVSSLSFQNGSAHRQPVAQINPVIHPVQRVHMRSGACSDRIVQWAT